LQANKSAEAFRTISEVADELDVHKHVLRFWEAKFPQLKPMKRGGGRRYYRSEDLDLLRGIRHLLHGEGYTIKGVQKVLREQGADHVKQCWRGGAAQGADAGPARRGRKGRPRAVAQAVEAPPAVGTVATPPATGRPSPAGSGREPTPDQVTAIRTAIEELEVARRILRGAPEREEAAKQAPRGRRPTTRR
jgi:DNA-binding transcriptional MerR regulator